MKDAKKNDKQPNFNRARSEGKRRPSLALVLSLLIHAALALLLLLPQPNLRNATEQKRKTEVELIDAAQLLKELQKQKEPEGQIVDQDEKAINDETPVESKFLSRHNQTVVKETQADLQGRFRNTDGSSGEKTVEKHASAPAPQAVSDGKIDQAKKDQTQSNKTEKAKQILTSESGVSTNKHLALKDLTPSFKPQPPPEDSDEVAQGGGDGPSMSDDHLKDIKSGMQTLLSTREFVYYTYYNRIKDKLRQYWEPKIKEKMEKIVRQGRMIASTSDRITKVVIILDSTGTLVRVQIVGPSGVNDLDDAAVEAFRAAAPFPNPPHGIADPDGTIKIRWDFILEA